MKGLCIWCVLVAFAPLQSASVLAFDNIEADVIYDREIRKPIMDEYLTAMKMLKAQAEGLGVAMRQKDVDALRRHMYEKSLLIAGCVDQAITLKKRTAKDVLSDKYVQKCVSDHIKLLDTNSGWMLLSCDALQPAERRTANPPYEFLDFTNVLYPDDKTLTSIANLGMLPDYIKLKVCVDRCARLKENRLEAKTNDYVQCNFFQR
jgi:hypothetical protein